MSAPILVAYTSRYGSTQEVAESIAQKLRESGLMVDLQHMKEVESLNSYRAVILGAPLYITRWHKDAHSFLTQHREALASLPVALFALGPIGTGEGEMASTRAQLDKDLAEYHWLKPVSVELFIGKYDPGRLGLLHKLIAVLPASPLHGVPASDNRDWHAIQDWTLDLPSKLR